MVDQDLQARLEVRGAVESMIKNLGPIAERKPETATKGEDFNALLERARQIFPASQAAKDMPKVEGGTTFADLLQKLSILDGAIKADFAARNYAETEEYNERNRQQWGRGLLDR